jgi:serine/threonine-protein kinase
LSWGPDSVRLKATLFDVTAARTLDQWELVDAADHMDRLVDSLTVRMLVGLGRIRPIGASPRSGLRGSSLPVLKAFLQGEQFYRRSEWDSALVYYQRAIDLDRSFAPAFRRASSTLAWRDRAHSPQVLEYAALAGANNHGWTPRDSLLIAVESQFFSVMGSSMVPGIDPTWMSRIRQLFASSEHAVMRYPDDPEAWGNLGEVYSHLGPYVGAPAQEQLIAFDRAIALDSAFSPAYIHPIEISSMSGVDAMRRYLRPYLRLVNDEPGAEGARLLESLLDGTGDSVAGLRNASHEALIVATFALSRLPDSAERIIDVVRRNSSRPEMPGMMMRMHHSTAAQRELARALISRGHLKAGLALLRGSEQTVSFAELALLGTVPAEQVEAAFRDSAPYPASLPFVARFPWWALHSDTAALRRAVALSESRARSDPDSNVRTMARYVAASAAAYGTLARRDTSGALEQLANLPRDNCPTCYLDRLTLAQLLTERKRDREAWQILQGDEPSGAVVPFPSEVLWVLLRGRVAERLGERDRAIQAYEWVAGMWRNADPELRPYVREAQNGVARLKNETGGSR